MNDDLVPWLLEQIAEDERIIHEEIRRVAELPPASWYIPEIILGGNPGDTARMLAECEAKRRIIEAHAAVTDSYLDPIGWCGADGPPADGRACSTCGTWTEYAVAFPCLTLRLLALPYADRPGYQERWRP